MASDGCARSHCHASPHELACICAPPSPGAAARRHGIKQCWTAPLVRDTDNFCDSAVAMMVSCLAFRERGFELKGRLVSERRVQPFLVVDLCEKVIDSTTGVTEVGEGRAVDLFGLQRLHEALGLGVVEGIARSAHVDVAIGQSLAIGDGGVLHAAIGMMDQAAGLWLSGIDGCIQRGNGKRGIERVLKGPAYSLRESIKNDCEIGEGFWRDARRWCRRPRFDRALMAPGRAPDWAQSETPRACRQVARNGALRWASNCPRA